MKVRLGGYIFAPRENAQLVESGFTSLQTLTGPAWKPKTVLSDFKFARDCFQRIFGDDIQLVGCDWHFYHDIPKHIKGYCVVLLYCVLTSFLRDNASEVIKYIRTNIVEARSVGEAEQAMMQLELQHPKAFAYFNATWWPEKERLLKCLTREHLTLNYSSNSIAEGSNHVVKTCFVNIAMSTSLSDLLRNLVDKDEADYRDELQFDAIHMVHHSAHMFSSVFMKHLDTIRAQGVNYVVTSVLDSDLKENESAAYYVQRRQNPLSYTHRVSKAKDQDLFTCSCKEDKTSGYPDRHIEAVAFSLGQTLDLETHVNQRWKYPARSQAPVTQTH
jgi:hypothetical protein